MTRAVTVLAEQNMFELEIQRVFELQTQLLVKQLKTLEGEVFKCASLQHRGEQAARGSTSSTAVVFQGKAELLDQSAQAGANGMNEDCQTKEHSNKRDSIDSELMNDDCQTKEHSNKEDTTDRESMSSSADASQRRSSISSEPRSSKKYAKFKKRDTTANFKQLAANDSGLLENFASTLTEKMKFPSPFSIKSIQQWKCVPSCIRDSTQRVVEHPFVVKIVTLLIILNAAVMAVEADDAIKKSIRRWHTAQKLQSDHVQIEDSPQWFATLDWIFAVLFTVECICRLLVYETSFFMNEEYIWNWLDFIVVVMAWVEIVMNATNQSSGGMPPVRLLRLIRIIRSIRLIRSLRFFSELRLLLLSLAHHVKPLIWSCIFLCLVMFMFANVFLQLLAASLNEHQVATNLEDTWPSFLIDRYSSFGEAMVALFGLITGGDNWVPYYKAFTEASYLAGITLLAYTGAIILGVLNVIAAVFVEAAMSKAKSDRDICLGEAQLTRKEMANELINVFHKIDIEDTGHITWQQWMEFLSTPSGEKFILLFEVELTQARKMYELLDDDGDGEVVIEEFVTGFMQICGAVNKLDVEFSAGKTNKMMRKLNQFMTDLEFHLGAIELQISQIAQAPVIASPSGEDLKHTARAIGFPGGEQLKHSTGRSSIQL